MVDHKRSLDTQRQHDGRWRVDIPNYSKGIYKVTCAFDMMKMFLRYTPYYGLASHTDLVTVSRHFNLIIFHTLPVRSLKLPIF